MSFRESETTSVISSAYYLQKDARILELERLLQEKESIINFKVERFGVERFCYDDSIFLFNAGFSSIKIFYAFLGFFLGDLLKPSPVIITQFQKEPTLDW